MHLMLATSESFHNKQNLTGNKHAFAQDFSNQSLSTQEIIDWVAAGKALCISTLRYGHRNKIHFQGSQLIGIDIDEGEIRTIEQLIQVPFIHQYAFYAGPTGSSTPDNPRSRIYFALDVAIQDSKQYEEIVIRIMQHLSTLGIAVDGACKDCVRLFYGSTVEGGWNMPEQVLPMSVIDTLAPLPQPKKAQKKQQGETPEQQPIPLNPEELGELEQQIRTALAYIPKKQDYANWLRILMAVYSVLPGQQGVALIEAWSPGYTGEVASKFKSFKTTTGDPITIQTLFWIARQNGWEENCDIVPDYLVNHRYISESVVPITLDKVWLIRSDMGTGKTELMIKLIKQWEEEHGSLPRILILTHRISLGSNLNQRFDEFNIQLYSDVDDNQYYLDGFDRLICTPNSLHRIRDENGHIPTYDMVVIDEIEQMLDHMVGKTFKGNEGVRANNIMRRVIGRATAVFALDAHASSVTYNYLKSSLSDVSQSADQLKLIVNTYRREWGNMYTYHSEDEWLTFMIDTCSANEKPVVIACDEKRKVIELATLLEKAGIPKVMQVHAENSKHEKVRHFLTHINEELPKYRVLIYSPTIGTGVDIQAEVKGVFAYFRNRSITAQEQHQMLVRCRKADHFYIYSVPAHSTRQTDEKAIFERHKKNIIRTSIECDFDLNDDPIMNYSQEIYLGLSSKLEARRNHRKNEIQYNFNLLAQANFIVQDASYKANEIVEILKQITIQRSEEIRELIFTAQPLSHDEAQTILETEDFTPEIEAGIIRYQVEYTYKDKISPELLTLWDRGKGSDRLYRFIDLYLTDYDLKKADLQEQEKQIAWRDRLHKTQVAQMYQDLFSLIWLGSFHTKQIKEEVILKIFLSDEFLDTIDKHYQAIYGVLGRRSKTVEEDKEKPLPLVRWLLKQIGLILETKNLGKKHDRTEYVLNDERLEMMLKYAKRRAATSDIKIEFNRPIFTKKSQ